MLGYGKMGKKIEELAQAAGHEFILKIDQENRHTLNRAALLKADVAIEFSEPASAVENIKLCLTNGLPIVSGTTGWQKQYVEICDLCLKENGAFFYASNYSIGVHLFRTINRQLANLLESQPSYQPQLTEIHHTQKLDAPSGTAITIAEDLIAEIDTKNRWSNEPTDHPETLSIISERIDKVPGTHRIDWHSAVDTIRLEHIAHSREGFAKGALAAATWIVGKKGVFGMKDMLGF
jgi:dihydrodipicolinate reductase